MPTRQRLLRLAEDFLERAEPSTAPSHAGQLDGKVGTSVCPELKLCYDNCSCLYAEPLATTVLRRAEGPRRHTAGRSDTSDSRRGKSQSGWCVGGRFTEPVIGSPSWERGNQSCVGSRSKIGPKTW